MLPNVVKTPETTEVMDNTLPGLDGLRGVAILLVMFFHLAQMKPVSRFDPIFYRITAYGWSGVDLFFVLSGFLITGILMDAKGTQNFFRNFYARRALRILPLYYGFFAVLLFVVPLVGTEAVVREAQELRENQWWMWTHTVNWLIAFTGDFHTATPLSVGGWWSLSIEEQFYLVWPLVVMLTPRRQFLRVCCGLVIASAVIRLGMAAFGASWTAAYAVTFAHMDGIAMGAVIAVVARSKVGLSNLKRWPIFVAVPALAGLVLIEVVPGVYHGLGATLAYSIQCTLFVWLWGSLVIATLTAPPDSYLQRITTLSILRTFGKFSFGLYLFHMNMNPLFSALGFDPDSGIVILRSVLPWQMFYLATAISFSFLCAFLSWNLYEKQFLKLKVFFPAPRRTATLPPRHAEGLH